MTAYPHLHVRSQYAALGGMCRLAPLVQLQSTNHPTAPTVAVTDPNLWAAAKLCKAAAAHKPAPGAQPPTPIYGLEVHLAEHPGHIVLLARNDHGWRNLRAVACLQGAAPARPDGTRPVPLKTLVAQCLLGGLAVLTGGAGGALCTALGGPTVATDTHYDTERCNDAADALLDALRDACEEGSAEARAAGLYVELAPTMGPAWRAAWAAAARHDLDVVATGDVAYLTPQEAPSYRVLRAIATKQRLPHDFDRDTAPHATQRAPQHHPAGARGGAAGAGLPPGDAQVGHAQVADQAHPVRLPAAAPLDVGGGAAVPTLPAPLHGTDGPPGAARQPHDVHAERGAWGHLATAEEMSAFFAECPAAIATAHALAAECRVDLGLGVVALPDYVGADGAPLGAAAQVAELRRMAWAGLEERFDQRPAGTAAGERGSLHDGGRYGSRLIDELAVIEATGFAGYFLIVADFCRWAKANGIPLGPGRGSAAGSLVVYSLGITDVDPVEYHLLFERFLTAERAGGAPDIDIDICKRGRQRVINYLRARYGKDSVGRIATYSVLGGKSALKDAARVFGVGYTELNSALAGVPDNVAGKAPSLAWLVANVPSLKEATEATVPTVAQARLAAAVRHGLALEGCVRQAGVHASGVVVSRGPLADWVPTLQTVPGKPGSELCSAWAMEEVEAAGLVKFDLLGLTTVTHLDLCERMINEQQEACEKAPDADGPRRDVARAGGGAADPRRDPADVARDPRPDAAASRGDGHVGDDGPRLQRPGGAERRPTADGCAGRAGATSRRGEDCSQDAAGTRAGAGIVGAAAAGPARRVARFSLAAVPLDDPATIALVAAADTLGVFQLCKGGMRRMLRQLKCDRFADIPAACALFRPGPLKSGMTQGYIRRKHGQEKTEAIHPVLDGVLATTYGTVVFQEQVMAAVRATAGYTLGQADIIRKIMGKKKADMLAKEKEKFVAAAAKYGVVDAATAARVWAVVEAASGYSFNLSHSVCYGLLSYRTAYAKVHHPAAFYAAWLSTLADEADPSRKVSEAVYDARAHGVEVLPPDVTRSDRDFKPTELPPSVHLNDRDGNGRPAVLYGLGALRGLGAAATAQITAQRTAHPFADLPDLLRRVDLNKRDLAALAGSGALDALLPPGATRAHLLANLDALAAAGRAARRAALSPQLGLFGVA